MEKFIGLKEEVVKDIPAADQTLYDSYPVYYSRDNAESFHQSKNQLIYLLDKITIENAPALAQLQVLKKRLVELVANHAEVEKQPILTDLKKRFESLYFYNQALLKSVHVEQFTDLTLGACYQGAYSNAVMLIDRIIAGDSLNNYLLSAKREFIQQQAFHFISATGSGVADIHGVNRLYNHVASSYNMQLIPDSWTLAREFEVTVLNEFAGYLRDAVTPLALLSLVQNKFVIPEIYDPQLMDEILPEHLRADWRCALYDAESKANDLERTGPLLLKVSLQSIGFIEDFVKVVAVQSMRNIKFYQTDDDIFIQEYIDDEVLCIDRYIVRVCQDSEEDYQLVKECYQVLREKSASLQGLPQGILLKLLDEYKEDAFSLIAALIDQGKEIAEADIFTIQAFLGQLDFLKVTGSTGAPILAVALDRGHPQIVKQIIDNSPYAQVINILIAYAASHGVLSTG
ncbi:hypothetical protein [Piscirickettsia salmonis]|nr:hypothetical protein [Piscirickettsia salmonis]